MPERAHDVAQARMNIGNYDILIGLDPNCKLMIGGVSYDVPVPVPNGMQLLIDPGCKLMVAGVLYMMYPYSCQMACSC